MNRRRRQQAPQPAALPSVSRLLLPLLIFLSFGVVVSLLFMNRVNEREAASYATATAVAHQTAIAHTNTQLTLAGTLASRALDEYQRDPHIGLLLAVEAYNLVADDPDTPPSIQHAIWQVLALGTQHTLTGTLAAETAVPSASLLSEWLAINDQDNAIQLFSLENNTLDQVIALDADTFGTDQFILSPNGRWLLSYGNSENAYLWDLSANELTKPRQTLTVSSTVNLVRFGPQTEWLAIGGEKDTAVHLWPFADGEPATEPRILTPSGAADSGNTLLGLAFDPEPQWLAAAYATHLDLWDLHALNTTSPIRMDVNEGKAFTAVAFSPNGQWLIAANSSVAANNSEKNIHLWNLHLDTLVKAACATADYKFSEDEWQQFFPTRPYAETCNQ